MDRTIEVLPNQSVVLHILDEVLLCNLSSSQVFDTIDRNNANIFNCSQQILEGDQIASKDKMIVVSKLIIYANDFNLTLVG